MFLKYFHNNTNMSIGFFNTMILKPILHYESDTSLILQTVPSEDVVKDRPTLSSIETFQ